MNDEIDLDGMAAEGIKAALDRDVKEILRKHNLQSVGLWVTRQDGNKCRTISSRAGNYYATYGAVRQWIVFEDAREAEGARQSMEGEP